MAPQDGGRDIAILEAEADFGPASLRDFDVNLDNFTGPFDLLLRLIARREMDLTEVALAAVTEEFLGYVRREPDLGSATDFLVVAATLLQMKSAALLPSAPVSEVLDEDLEARDLLFARLVQYRAFQRAAEGLATRWEENRGRIPRAAPLPEPYASLMPTLRWAITPEEFAHVASQALTPPPRPDLADHVARPQASFAQELQFVSKRLQQGPATFGELVAGAANSAVIVTRFLVLLQLYREGRLEFHQSHPMGELAVELIGRGTDD